MEVHLPEYYIDNGDNVSYRAIDKSGQQHDRRNSVCYYDLVRNSVHKPGDWEILCLPTQGRNSAPPLIFQRFFLHLQRYGLVPRKAKARVKKGQNVLLIPREGWGYHPVFITLSLYRHTDVHGRSILGRTMKLYDRLHKEGTHFLQCLHWALVHTKHGTWHSCFSLGAPGPYSGTNRKKVFNLKYGLALAVYGQLSPEEKNALTDNYSTSMFDRLAEDLIDIELRELDQILDPQYARYYQNPDLARK